MNEQVLLFGRKKNDNPAFDINYQGDNYLSFVESLNSSTYLLANPVFFVKSEQQLSKPLRLSFRSGFGKSIAKKIIPSTWSKTSNYNSKILVLEGFEFLINNTVQLEFELVDDEITISWDLYRTKKENGHFRKIGQKENITFTISKKGIPISVNLTGTGQVQIKDTTTNTILSTFSTAGNYTTYVPKGADVAIDFSVDTNIDSPSDAKSSKFLFQRLGEIFLDGLAINPAVTATMPNATGQVQMPITYSHTLTNVQIPKAINVGFEKSSEKQFYGHYKAQSGTNHLNDYVAYDTAAPALILDTNTTPTVQQMNDLTGKGHHLEQLQAGKSTQSGFDGTKIDFNGTINQGYEMKAPRVNLTNVNGRRLFSFLVYKVGVVNVRNAVMSDVAGQEGGNNGGNVFFADRNNIKVGFDAPSYGGGVIRTGLSTAMTLTNLLPDPAKLESHTIASDAYTKNTSGTMSNSLSRRYGYLRTIIGNVRNNWAGKRGKQPSKYDFYEQLIIDNFHTAAEVEVIMEELKAAYAI